MNESSPPLDPSGDHIHEVLLGDALSERYLSYALSTLMSRSLPDVRDMLVDVKHTPGWNIPEPVRHIQYEENHPTHHPGELSHPAAGQCNY